MHCCQGAARRSRSRDPLQRKLETAGDTIYRLNEALEKCESREDSGADLRRQVAELTAAAADAMAERTRAFELQKALKDQVRPPDNGVAYLPLTPNPQCESAVRTNKTMMAERADFCRHIENLEAQVKELQAQLQHASLSAVPSPVRNEADLEAVKSAFEKEKQEAVRKAIESCSERSKVENIKLQVCDLTCTELLAIRLIRALIFPTERAQAREQQTGRVRAKVE